MANAKLAVPKIQKWEGGWADNPNDPGGATMRGITLNTFIGYRLKKGLPRPTRDDLRNITDQEWYEVFKKEFWDELQADQIDNQSIADFLMDWFWMSWDDAVIAAQKIVGTKPDGAAGPKTIAAINAAHPLSLFNSLKAARVKYYEDLIGKKPRLETFRKGWMNRIKDYTFLA